MKKTISLILCLAMIISSVAFCFPASASEDLASTPKTEAATLSAAYDGNIIVGGDFESGANPFEINTNLAEMVIEEDPETGNHYLTKRAITTGQSWSGLYTRVDWKENTKYRLSFKWKNSGSYGKPDDNTAGMYLNIWFLGNITSHTAGVSYGLHGQETWTHMHNIANGGDWKEKTVDFSLTKTGVYEKEAIYFFSNPSGSNTSNFSIDDVKLYEETKIEFAPDMYTKLKDGASLPTMEKGIFLDGKDVPELAVPEVVGEFPFEAVNSKIVLDTEKPWKDALGNTYAAGDMVDFSNGPVVLTPNYTINAETATVEFAAHAEVSGLPEAVEVIKGDALDLVALVNNANVFNGKRITGWSLTGEDVAFGEDGFYDDPTIAVSDDMVITPIVNYDYNFAIQSVEEWTGGDATLEQNDKFMTVSAASNDGYIERKMTLPMDFMGSVDIIVDPSYTADGSSATFSDGYGAQGLYFAGVTGGADENRRIAGAFNRNIETADGESLAAIRTSFIHEAWNGTLGYFRYDLTNVKSEYNVRYIQFNKKTPFDIDHINITDLDAPVVGYQPDGTYTVDAKITSPVSVTWIGDKWMDDGSYGPATVYSVAIEVVPSKTSANLFPANLTATINGENADVEVYNDGMNAVITHEFPATEAFLEFNMEIAGPTVIAKIGRLAKYALDIDNPEVPNTSAKWSVDNTAIATINENTGALLPITNGVVNITAVSVYNPEIVATLEVSIEADLDTHLLNYHPGTMDEVTGMPEDTMATVGTYALANVAPEREGYIFKGWATSEDSAEAVTSIKVTGPTTVYALWDQAGVTFDFNNMSYLTSGFTNAVIDPETGVLSSDVIGDHLIYFYPKTADGKLLYGGDYPYMEISYASSDEAGLTFDTYFTSKKTADPNSGWKSAPVDQNANQYVSTYVNQTIHNGKIGEFNTAVIDRSKFTNWVNGYIYDIRFDTTDGDRHLDIEYIRLFGKAKVSYDLNTDGRVINAVAFKDKSIAVGETLKASTPVRQDGVKFLGWAKFTDSTLEPKTEFTVTGDTTLYAIWDEPVAPDAVITTTDDTQALVVTTDAGEGAVVTFTYGTDGVMKETTNSNGQVIFDLIDVAAVADGKLAVSTGSITRYATAVNYTAAYDIVNSEGNGEETGSGDITITTGKGDATVRVDKYKYDNKLTEIKNDGTLYTITKPVEEEETTDKVEINRFPVVNEGDMPFADVASTEWYHPEIAAAYKLGLVQGTTATTYNPSGSVTVAEAITMAVRMNASYNGVAAPAAATTGNWYDTYVAEAIALKIIRANQFTDYNVPALRKEVASIMAKALPNENYAKMNMFLNVPDMDKKDRNYSAVLKLYNAGILTGSDDEYNFRPDTEINRAEVAAIMNRVTTPANRKRVVTQAEIESRKVKFTALEITNASTLGNCTEKTLKMKDGIAWATGAELSGGRADPILYFIDLFGGLDGSKYTKLTVAVKSDEEGGVKVNGGIFFTTPSGSWAADRYIAPSGSTLLENGIREITFDLTSHNQFKGEITGIRFDPFDAAREWGFAYMIIE